MLFWTLAAHACTEIVVTPTAESKTKSARRHAHAAYPNVLLEGGVLAHVPDEVQRRLRHFLGSLHATQWDLRISIGVVIDSAGCYHTRTLQRSQQRQTRQPCRKEELGPYQARARMPPAHTAIHGCLIIWSTVIRFSGSIASKPLMRSLTAVCTAREERLEHNADPPSRRRKTM